MSNLPLAPVNESITIAELTDNPYPFYRTFRADTPVLRVKALGRTLLTKAEHTKAVKDDPDRFSSDDPNTPMEKAFQAKTLMRRDGQDHMRLRKAMMPAFSAKNIKTVWGPLYQEIAEQYVGSLPRGETVDFFEALAGPVAARCSLHLPLLPTHCWRGRPDQACAAPHNRTADAAPHQRAPRFFQRACVELPYIESCR